MSECVCVFVDARLSPVEEAQCVSVEVEGERRASLYKSGQITEVERPATPLHCPASSALCQPTHTPLESRDLVEAVRAAAEDRSADSGPECLRSCCAVGVTRTVST